MSIPNIDFNYWYNRNLEDSKNIQQRSKSMVSKIANIYEINNNYNQSYFCGNIEEVHRLKNLNYIDLENEIIKQIINIENIDSEKDASILKIFDLINIWGGLTGGSNFYHIKNDSSPRLDYKNWLPEYKELINMAILKDLNAYKYILNNNIPGLRMSFGSKHISFWSRKNANTRCLIIIDNKIAGTTGFKKANDANYSMIVSELHKLEDDLKMEPHKLEKALFTFHMHFFDNKNSKFYGKIGDNDYSIALKLKKQLNIIE